jgi:hypothetical protein
MRASGRVRALTWSGVVAISTSAVLVQPADAAVLCRKRSGQVIIAERCGRRQTPLSPQDLGLVGPAGQAGAPGADGERGMLPDRVVDATGRQVGTVLSQIGSRTQVVFAHDALAVPIQLSVQDGAIGDGSFMDRLFYESPDCTGTPFITESGSPLPRGQQVGDLLYYSTEVGPLLGTSFGSVEQDDDPSCSGGMVTVRGTCCRMPGGTARAGGATGVPLSTLGITLPLTVEPRP